MLSRRIIPCLDVRDGQVVKGVRFRDHVVMGAIEDLALRYRDEGADELVFYDITASPEGRGVDLAWVDRVARLIDIPFCVAGGIRSVDTARAVLHAGADKISVNTPALERPIRSEPKKGQMMPVKVATHVTGTLIFASGALIQVTLSFDVPKHSHLPYELYGTEGTLLNPDPNMFGGEVADVGMSYISALARETFQIVERRLVLGGDGMQVNARSSICSGREQSRHGADQILSASMT